MSAVLEFEEVAGTGSLPGVRGHQRAREWGTRPPLKVKLKTAHSKPERASWNSFLLCIVMAQAWETPAPWKAVSCPHLLMPAMTSDNLLPIFLLLPQLCNKLYRLIQSVFLIPGYVISSRGWAWKRPAPVTPCALPVLQAWIQGDGSGQKGLVAFVYLGLVRVDVAEQSRSGFGKVP